MVKWILMVAFSAAWQGALAADAKAPPLSLTDSYSQIWAAMDNPAGLRAWAREQISSLDPEQEGILWVQAVAALFRNLETGEDTTEQRNLLEKALELSRQYEIPPDALFTLKVAEIDFKVIEDYGRGGIPPPDVSDQLFLQKEQLAERLNLPGRKALTSLGWGVFMLDSGRDGEAVKKIHEALRELNKSQNVSDLELIEAKGIYANALLNIQSTEKSKAIYSELEHFCDARKARMFCLGVDQVYAYLLLNEKTPAAYAESLFSLNRSLAVAEELQDEQLIASTSNLMVRLLGHMERYDEALTSGLRAIEIFQKHNNLVWLGDTQRKLSIIYLNLKQPEKSLELLALASRNFPNNYSSDHAEIFFQKARAYRALHQYKEAYEAMNFYAKALKENASRNQSTEIAQSLTEINLELEEEHSRSLTQAEQQQKIQVERELANRIEQEQTLMLINGIWMASGLLVLSCAMGLIWIWQQNKRIIRLNRHLREDILQRFLPPVIAERVAKGQAVLDETPHEQELTALFGRLVGLEHAIEDLGPRVTARLLESLMQAVTDVSMEHKGCLDKLHRGSFLILFGAPIQCTADEQIEQAISFAHSLQERFEQIRESWPTVEGWRPGLAIGIHHGSALVGVFGGKRRADYTAVGQTVNLAARIEGEAKSGEILISEKIAKVIGEDRCLSLGDVRLKGISKTQNLFRLAARKVERNAS